MDKKVVLMTGGNRGIGAETALLAAAKGWDVCISFRSREKEANKVIESIERAGQSALAIQADVGSEKDVLRLFAELNKRFDHLDALVNNAGIVTQQSRLVDMDAERIRTVLNINVLGSFLCAIEAIKRMSTRSGGRGGSIVNLSSTAARIGSPNEFVDYAASKGAIDSMTLGLSKEIAAEGIRVNAVRPGLIQTEMHGDTGDPNRLDNLKAHIPMKRAGSAREVAQSTVWLMSGDASYVNGAILDVAGGR